MANAYRYNGRIITMEPILVFGVYAVELSLKWLQTGVIPGCIAQTHKFNNSTNVTFAEVLAQRLGEFLQSWLLFSSFVLNGTRQQKGLEE